MIIPIYDQLMLPGTSYPLTVKNINKEALQSLIQSGEHFTALPLIKQVEGTPSDADFHKIGALLHPTAIKESKHGLQMMVTVTSLAEVSNIHLEGNKLQGNVMVLDDITDLDPNSISEMIKYIKALAAKTGRLFKMQNTEEIMGVINDFSDLNKLMAYISQFINLSPGEKYLLMETNSMKDRSLLFIDFYNRFHESMKLQIEMAEHFTEQANKNYREQALREQLRMIQEELNEGSESGGKKSYSERIEAAGMPEDIKSVALEELSKLESQNPQSSDYNVIRNYLDFLLDLPWTVEDTSDISVINARKVLDKDHYGLEKVKERIIQHLAVMQLKKNKKGSIILLAGPPGTGKTSLGKSIAEAMDRKYVRISLGGIRDEAQIRGHRRTYVGALPGRILKAMKDAGTMNPVMVLDEVDKLMVGFSGDPASALLEVLDPEQNNTFTDHYLDLPYDLSHVMFITTANSLENIPRPLLDRMEAIQISSYTPTEKFHIAKRHLLKKTLEEHGLEPEDFVLEDDALIKIISEFTMEAGVRGLKKQLDKLSRVTAEKVVSGESPKPFIVTTDNLDDLLGHKISRHQKAQDNNPSGVVTGLAWTPVGGEILFIEATDIPGKGEITLTGQLGDVMQESARIALSLLKSRLPSNTVSFKEKDIHVHIPSGAVPKDGPSAGIALFSALASLVTGIPVEGKLAMTGEVSLRGIVLPIGGLKEKLIAAQRAGITKALIPVDNKIDLKEIPDEVKDSLDIIPVETIEDVLKETLHIQLPKINAVSWLNQEDKGDYLLP